MATTPTDNDVMPSLRGASPTDDDIMPSLRDDVMPSIKAEEDAKQAALNASIDPTAFLDSVHQPSQFGSGYSEDPPNLLNADDWGFTAALAGPQGPPAMAGKALNFAGQALKGDAESMLFAAAGDKEDANQQLISAAEKMMPSTVAKDRALGIKGTDPFEESRATLPTWQRMASGVAPGLIQTAPQIALTAVQPEIGAFSFGLTPQGFDPVQAASMMIAPGGGKMLGGIAEKLAAKAGITSEAARGIINRVGGGTGVAGLISAPTIYEIAQMKPGPERDEAIQDAASNAIIAGGLGGMERGPVEGEKPGVATAGTNENVAPGANTEDVLPSEAAKTGKVEVSQDLAKEVEAALQGNQVAAPRAITAPTPKVEAPSGTIPTLGQRMIDELRAEAASKKTPEANPTPALEASQVPAPPADVSPIKADTPIKVDNGGASPSDQSSLVGVPVRQIPASEITTRPDLMQFKRMDNADSGVNENDKLSGKWDDLKAGNLLLWEPKEPGQYGLPPGQKYIVANGHHRFEFGQRNGVKGYNAQIVREAEGYSPEDARRLGAEINIADGKGTIYDQAKFIRNTAAAHGADAAMEAAGRVGARGRKAAAIGLSAGDPLWDSFVNERITPDQAEAIANAAPRNDAAQQIGIRFAVQGKPPEFLSNVVKASLAEAGQRAQSLDLFGQDDSAMRQMEEQANRAAQIQKGIAEQIRAVQGAAKRPDIAAKLGVDVKDPEGVTKRVEELKGQLERWKNWPMHPDLRAQVKGEPPPGPMELREGPDFQFDQPESVGEQKARMAAKEKARLQRAQQEEMQTKAGKPLTGGTGDLGQKDMFGGGDLFSMRERIGEHPVDRTVVDSVSSLYAAPKDKLQAALQDEKPYQPELGLQVGPQPAAAVPGRARNNALAGRRSAGADAGAGAGQAELGLSQAGHAEAERLALTTLNPKALAAAFGHDLRISSLDPKAAPRDIPQYRVNGTVIENARDFVKTLIALRSPYAESVKVAILDDNNRVVHSQVLYAGTLDSASVDARDFVRLFDQFGSQGKRMLISHNHPGGDPSPSDADLAFTHQLDGYVRRAGFELVDHVITNGRKYYSWRGRTIEVLPKEDWVEHKWEKVPREDLLGPADEHTFKWIVNALRQSNPDAAHIIYLNTRNKVLAIERILAEGGQKLIDGNRIFRQLQMGVSREGARAYMVDFGPSVSNGEAMHMTDLFKRGMRGSQTDMLDFACQGTPSGKAVGLISETPNAGPIHNGETTASLKEGDSYDGLKMRRQEIEERLADIGREASALGKRFQKLPPELRAERFRLSKELRGIRQQMLKQPEHIAAMLKHLDTLQHNYAVAKREGREDIAKQMREEIMAHADEGHELNQADPDLVARVRKELMDRGEITRQTEPVPGGRTLGSVVDWLRQNKLDSPKPSLLDRLNFTRRLQEEWDKGKTWVQNLGDKMAATWEAFKQQYRQPPTDTEFRGLMKDWFFEKQWTGLETHRWVSEIKKQIPSKLRRMALSVYLDADGDENVLREQGEHVPAKWRPVWDTALALTDKEKALANRIRNDFEQKLGDAQLAGLLDQGRADYGVPQVWDRVPEHEDEFDPFAEDEDDRRTPRNPKAKLDPRAPFFALRRTSPSYFDGIMAKGVPKSLDIADLVGLYNAEFHNSLADRGVIFALKNAKAADGKPIVQISGQAHIQPREAGARTYFVDPNWRPKDAVTADGRPYQPIDHWALRDWKFASKDEHGNPIIVRGDFLVHPDHFKFLRNELEKSWLRDPDRGGKYFGWVLNSAGFMKASKFASATFHMATIGEHSFFHAFAGMPSAERLSLLNPSTRGVEISPERDPELLQLMRHGLYLGFDGQQELFEEGLSGHGGIWGKVPGLGDAIRTASDFLFKRYIPAVKARAGKVILHANVERYRGKLSQQQIYELTANQVNAGFGGQNWRLLGTNKTLLDANRLFFTAPDFLLSRSKVVAQAFKPFNREQALFLLAQAGIVYTAARALNLAFSPNHDPHFEAENAFSVIIGDRAYSARFIVSDMLGFMNDMLSLGHGKGATLPFLAGRLGPLPRTAYEAMSGNDMRTGRTIQTHFQHGAARAAEIAARDMAEWFVPIGAEGLLPGAKNRDQSVLGQMGLMFLGIGSHEYSKQQRKILPGPRSTLAPLHSP